MQANEGKNINSTKTWITTTAATMMVTLIIQVHVQLKHMPLS
jgi:hypothetical protein